ncbi:hypothetical protein ABZT27_33675 [Streptomyces sp. NPDC005389]
MRVASSSFRVVAKSNVAALASLAHRYIPELDAHPGCAPGRLPGR